MSAPTGEAVVRALWDALRPDGDRDAVLALLTEDYVRHTSGGGQVGRDGFVSMMRGLHTAFPDLRTQVEDVVCADKRVAYRWSSSGTHQGEYLGVAPTGRRITASGITFAHLRDGRIAQEWTSWNKTSVLHALGIFPLDP